MVQIRRGNMQKIKGYKEYFNDIESQNYFGRLGKTFMTKANYYFYDMGIVT